MKRLKESEIFILQTKPYTIDIYYLLIFNIIDLFIYHMLLLFIHFELNDK